MAGKYYEDLEPGMTFQHSLGRTVTEADNVLFCSLTLNTQPLHINEDFASKTEFGRRIVNGLFTMSLVVGITVSDLTDGTIIANLGYENIKHLRPVFHGDTIYAETTIVSRRESKSRPNCGIVTMTHIGRNQRGEAVVELTRSALFFEAGVCKPMTLTMRAPIHDLPPDYAEIRNVVLTEDRLLIKLNLLAIVPLLLMLVWMAIWWVIVSVGRAPQPAPDIPWWLALIVVIVVVLPFHELLHGVTIRLFGQRVRYGMNLSKGVLYATSENALFRRNEYLAVALAPLVGITLLAMILMAIVPQWLAYYVGIAAVLNAGGAIGDLWSVGILLRYPASVLVRDEAEGFRIYASGFAAGSSIQNSEPPAAG